MNPAACSDQTTLRIRSMFPGEIIELENSCSDKNGERIEWRSSHYFELMAAFSLVDADGKRIFTDDDIRTTWWKKQHRDYFREMIAAVRSVNDKKSLAKEQEAEIKNSLEAGVIDSLEE